MNNVQQLLVQHQGELCRVSAHILDLQDRRRELQAIVATLQAVSPNLVPAKAGAASEAPPDGAAETASS